MPDSQIPAAKWRHDRDYKVVPVDDSRSVLFLTGNHRVFEVPAATGRRLAGGPECLTGEEAAEWQRLAASAQFAEINRSVLARSGNEDGANLALNINLTGACNLACVYCFAEGGDYGRITGKMKSDTVDDIFTFIRRHVTRSRVVRLEFFGGEPLLNFPLIEEICARSDDFSAETGITFINRISTNLTVLPRRAPELFRNRRFIVSVSIDGGAATHDRNRPTKSGRPSFHKIIENCQCVRAVGGDNVTMVARMTITGGERGLVANVVDLWSLNLFDYFQIYPAVTAAGSCNGGDGLAQMGAAIGTNGASAPQPTMNRAFLRELAELLEIYPILFRSENRFKGGLEYERLAQMVIEGRIALGFCSAGRTYFTVSPDRSIMPCHRMVGDTAHQAGTTAEGVTADLSEWALPVDSHPVCGTCWARYACGGNCLQENYVASGQLRELNEETCRYQKRLFEEVLRLIGRTRGVYHRGDRSRLDDLFVSCGRPVVGNGRSETATNGAGWRYFRPVLSAGATGKPA